MNKKILVIAAHPDDEILGCGGTIAKHSNDGDIVNVLLLGSGIKSRKIESGLEQKQLEILGKSSLNANKLLGVKNIFFEDFPDNELDSVSRLSVVRILESYIEKIKPEIIYTHHFSDLNIDHKRISESVLIASRPIPGQLVKKILFFEVASSTNWNFGLNNQNFNPNYFVDISEFLDLKLNALEFYKMEMREYPHSRSIKSLKSLALWRGSSIGVYAAEAFVLARSLED